MTPVIYFFNFYGSGFILLWVWIGCHMKPHARRRLGITLAVLVLVAGILGVIAWPGDGMTCFASAAASSAPILAVGLFLIWTVQHSWGLIPSGLAIMLFPPVIGFMMFVILGVTGQITGGY